MGKEACLAGRILVNGRQGKPGTEIKPGDILQIDWGGTMLELEVLAVAPVRSKRDAATLYRVIREQKKDLPK